MIKNQKKDKIVLVSVVKDKRDLNILLTKNWYRIPLASAPRRKFKYLAFYQPALFGRQGKSIRYYAPVLNYQTNKRKNLLPDESNHPRAQDYYFKVRIGKVKKLAQPVRNIRPRRISFGFTTLNHLLESKNILQLYNVPATEEIVENALKQTGIKAISQYYLRGRRYCLDFAIFCKKGAIAIECDNKKAHSIMRQRAKDKIKNAFLRQHGWTVIRLPEDDIIFDLKSCIVRIRKAIQKLGGL